MVGFIFGIIFLIAGIIAAVCLAQYKRVEKTEEYVLDEEGNRVRSSYGGYRTTTKETVTKPLAKFSVVSVVAGVFLAILLTFFGCIASVDTGHVGIVKTFGKVEDYTFDSGFHLKAPWNSVTQMDNRVQKTTVELPCFSSDIQEVNTTYTVNYQISKTNAQNLYRDVGIGYLETVVNPTIQESVKTVVAKYTAEKLISERATLAEEIEALLAANLAKYNIDVTSTAIENMDFTDSFTNAVEAKVVAEQNKIKAEKENEQALAKAENDKLIAIKNAEAQAAANIEAANAAAAIVRIEAEAAEYQGQKEAAIALQRLASINGWTVVTESTAEVVKVPKYTVVDGTKIPVYEKDKDGNDTDKVATEEVVVVTTVHKLVDVNGNEVSPDKIEEGAKKLIEYYYTQTWDGKLPDTFVGDGDISNIIIGTN
jgi:regulator of protease activity HflC (stomatin/prohibitin superfamily)